MPYLMVFMCPNCNNFGLGGGGGGRETHKGFEQVLLYKVGPVQQPVNSHSS